MNDAPKSSIEPVLPRVSLHMPGALPVNASEFINYEIKYHHSVAFYTLGNCCLGLRFTEAYYSSCQHQLDWDLKYFNPLLLKSLSAYLNRLESWGHMQKVGKIGYEAIISFVGVWLQGSKVHDCTSLTP